MSIMSFFFQAVSNSSCAVNGKLTQWDSRWPVIEQMADDRSPREINTLPNSRYYAVSFVISDDPRNKNSYNDAKFTLNKRFRRKIKRAFKELGSDFYKDTKLLNHYGYLFVREALIVSDVHDSDDNMQECLHFDAVQSTNWNNVRFKPPPYFNSKLGWLMEFRSMDVPITAREKTALIFFVTLFVRMILDQKLGVNLYVPISKVDSNFARCVLMNSDINEKFYFRRYFCEYLHGKNVRNDEMVELTLAELLEGNSNFDGIKALIQAFVQVNAENLKAESKKLGYNVVNCIWEVYRFYVARCKNELMSNSRFIRNFIRSHNDYKFDSLVPDSIVTDLIDKLLEIQRSDYHDSLFGDYLAHLDAKL